MMHKYEKAQKYVVFNDNDEALKPIVLKLPTPPKLRYIKGYGKHPYEQVWEPLEVPDKLKQLEERATENMEDWAKKRTDRRVTEYVVSKEFWRLLEENKDHYEYEIDYIRKIHYFLYYGYWFFNKGVPTWIPPTYFRYLNFWYIPDNRLPGNRPLYRDVDRRTYIFKWYCRTTNETLGNLDEQGYAQKGLDGKYEVNQKPNRTVFGHIKPKRRREGASNQECSDGLWCAERNKKGDFVIMADKGDSADDIYSKIMLVGFMKQPLILKPINETYQNSSSIDFTPPSHVFREKSMDSVISFVNTASEGAVDRMKLYNILSDESAKLKRSDAWRRHNISKPTLAQINDIHGYMAYPSTVEEMEDGGGAYKDIWLESDFYRRNPAGQTMSGLLRIFWPAWDGLDGYIDKWGMSVIEDPTEEQIKYAPKKADYVNGVGAKRYLEETVGQMLASGTYEGERQYKEYIRKHPMKSDDCWKGKSGDIGWDSIGVEQRIAVLNRENKGLLRGNFEWKSGVKNNPNGVEFIEDKVNGRFYVSDLFLNRNNLWTWTPSAMVWDEKKSQFVRAKMPLHPTVCTAGADPFDYGTSSETRGRKGGSRMSDGGIHLLLNYDDQVDKDASKDQWQTYKTIVSYRHRPKSLDDYCDDVVKMCVYYGAMLSVERNKTRLWEYMIDNGYGGYLIYMTNPDGTVEKKPGIWTGQGFGSKDNSFNLVRDYISYRLPHEIHIRLLEEMRDIQGPEKLKDYDLLTAFMCSLIGAEKGYQGRFTRITDSQTIDISGTIFSRHKAF